MPVLSGQAGALASDCAERGKSGAELPAVANIREDGSVAGEGGVRAVRRCEEAHASPSRLLR
jgi:hypothetical protein